MKKLSGLRVFGVIAFLSMAQIVQAEHSADSSGKVNCVLSGTKPAGSAEDFWTTIDGSKAEDSKVVSYNSDQGGTESLAIVSKDRNFRVDADFSLYVPQGSETLEVRAALKATDDYRKSLARSESRMSFLNNAELSGLYESAELRLYLPVGQGKESLIVLKCKKPSTPE